MLNPKKTKIPLPECFFDEALHIQTGKYWELAQIWNNRVPQSLTINEAMSYANNILKELNPQRPLASRVEEVKQNIVMHGTKKRMLKNACNDDQINKVPRLYVL